ncbi:MAG: DUF6602 domain-containing protein [Ginsengibacter sp.]
MTNIEKLYTYFRSKSAEIAIIAEQAILTHPGIIGDHREKIINIFLKEFLPHKYSIDTGQFMGVEFQRDFESKQSDIIIWDSVDYPKIHLQGAASLFFAESVKMVIEVKSHFNNKEFEDIKLKSRSLKKFVPNFHPSIKDEIWRLDNKIARSIAGKMEMTLLASAPSIAMAAICYKGGENFKLETMGSTKNFEDDLPDVILLLNVGKLVAKTYEILPNGKVNGILKLYKMGENSLIGFTGWITSLLAERDTLTTSPFEFHNYIMDIYNSCEIESLNFPVTRVASGMEIID